MLTLSCPRESSQFKCLEELGEMQGLSHIHYIQRSLQLWVIAEFLYRKCKVFGGVERGAIRAEDDEHTVFFFGASQEFIQLDNDRPAGGSFICGDSFLDQFFNRSLTGFFHLTGK